MSTTPNITHRAPLTTPQIDAIMRAAAAAGAHPVPVQGRDGAVDEVAIFAGGENLGSVFRPGASGGIAIWINCGRQRRVSSPGQAVRAILKG
jgi:hypothetical protein